MPGLYCTGWVKRGPTGIINSNIIDARETVACIMEDLKAGRLPTPPKATSQLTDLLQPTRFQEVVTWAKYKKIDVAETAAGQAKGKPREKLVDVRDMIRLAQS